MEKEISFLDSVEIAKRLTSNYAKSHKGRNKLEKECIKKGYLIKRYSEIFDDCIEEEKFKTGIFAMDFNSVHRKGGFVLVR